MNKALLLLAGVACLLLLILYAPDKTISPGHLGKAHASLEKDCLACHELKSGVSTEKCIQCHKLQNIGLDTATGKHKFFTNSSAFNAFVATQSY